MGKSHRRFPGLSRDDVTALDELERTRGAGAAREYENFIRRQNGSDASFRRRHTLETDLGVPIDSAIAASRSQTARRGDRQRRRAA